MKQLDILSIKEFDLENKRTTKYIFETKGDGVVYFRNYASHKGKELYTRDLELGYYHIAKAMNIPCAVYEEYNYEGEVGSITYILPNSKNLVEYLYDFHNGQGVNFFLVNQSSNYIKIRDILKHFYPNDYKELLYDLERIYYLDVIFLNFDRTLYNLVIQEDTKPKLYAIDHTELLGNRIVHDDNEKEKIDEPVINEIDEMFIKYYIHSPKRTRNAINGFITKLEKVIKEVNINEKILDQLQKRIIKIKLYITDSKMKKGKKNYYLLPPSLCPSDINIDLDYDNIDIDSNEQVTNELDKFWREISMKSKYEAITREDLKKLNEQHFFGRHKYTYNELMSKIRYANKRIENIEKERNNMLHLSPKLWQTEIDERMEMYDNQVYEHRIRIDDYEFMTRLLKFEIDSIGADIPYYACLDILKYTYSILFPLYKSYKRKIEKLKYNDNNINGSLFEFREEVGTRLYYTVLSFKAISKDIDEAAPKKENQRLGEDGYILSKMNHYIEYLNVYFKNKYKHFEEIVNGTDEKTLFALVNKYDEVKKNLLVLEDEINNLFHEFKIDGTLGLKYY